MVGRFFLWLFWACRHEWTILDIRRFHAPDVAGQRVILRCRKCGDVQKKDLL